MTVIVVTGDRNWTDEKLVYEQLTPYPTGTVLIHGDDGDRRGKIGLDRMAARIGKMLGFKVLAFPAEWEKYGRAAGPRRNEEMLDYDWDGPIDIVIGFHDTIMDSKGTKHCLRAARQRGLRVRLVSHSGVIEHFRGDVLEDVENMASGSAKPQQLELKMNAD